MILDIIIKIEKDINYLIYQINFKGVKMDENDAPRMWSKEELSEFIWDIDWDYLSHNLEDKITSLDSRLEDVEQTANNADTTANSADSELDSYIKFAEDIFMQMASDIKDLQNEVEELKDDVKWLMKLQ